MGGVKEITKNGAKFMDGNEERFDSVILATGYKSNVPSWLKVNKLIIFSRKQSRLDCHQTYF